MIQNSTIHADSNSTIAVNNTPVAVKEVRFVNPFDHWALTLEDVLMILENYHDLSAGNKPDSPPGYDNPESQRARSHHASYENMGMLCGEVCRRVRLCGLDSYLTEERYGLNYEAWPKSIDDIARDRCLDAEYIFRHISWVTAYCTGRNLKKESYKIFCDRGHYRYYLEDIT